MKKLAGALIAIGFTTAVYAGDPPRFVYVDLSAAFPDGTIRASIANSINEAGIVTGGAMSLTRSDSGDPAYAYFAFKAAPGQAMVNISTQPELDPLGSEGKDINDQGVVVGQAVYTNIDLATDSMPPVMWAHGAVVSLGLPKGAIPAIGQAFAYAVNDHNQIVGVNAPASGEPGTRSFLWENGQMRLLDELGDVFSRAWDINNLGHVVGQAVDPGVGARPYLLRDGVVTFLADTGWALGINDLDQVVGTGGNFDDDNSGGGAFVWENGALQPLPTAPGTNFVKAKDINDFGDIVGWGSLGAVFASQGVSYNLIDLIQPVPKGSFRLARARGINDKGQIVGEAFGFNADGYLVFIAYRLDPVTPDISGDGVVDGLDLARLIIAWGSDDPYIDLDGDGVVNTADLTDLLLHWGPVPERKPYFWTK